MQGMFDMHCHILQGTDDGPKSLEEALTLLLTEYGQGIRHVILTPHNRKHMFETDEKVILEQYVRLKEKAYQVLPDMELYLGCEFHVNMHMIETLQRRASLCMAKSSYVLVEFSETHSRDFMRERLYQLRSNGYTPIVAHAERYNCIRKNPGFVEDLVEMGVKIQVNADSILGKAGGKVKKFCLLLMKSNLLHYIGSDAHDLKRRPPRMGDCAKYVAKKMGHNYVEQIFVKNPSQIIR